MDYDSIIKDCKKSMQKALDHLREEYKAVRTGRASPQLLENITFDYYGSQTKVGSAATISVVDAGQLMVKPFDVSQLRTISKAISDAKLGLTPQDDGKVIRIKLPPMTEENRKRIATQLKEMAEKVKVTIRNARHDANKHADETHKKSPGVLSEDAHRDLKKDIQGETDKFNKLVDEELKSKTEEVMKV